MKMTDQTLKILGMAASVAGFGITLAGGYIAGKQQELAIKEAVKEEIDRQNQKTEGEA